MSRALPIPNAHPAPVKVGGQAPPVQPVPFPVRTEANPTIPVLPANALTVGQSIPSATRALSFATTQIPPTPKERLTTLARAAPVMEVGQVRTAKQAPSLARTAGHPMKAARLVSTAQIIGVTYFAIFVSGRVRTEGLSGWTVRNVPAQTFTLVISAGHATWTARTKGS